MLTVKLSYTTLSAWSQGRQEDAVSYYLGKKLPQTPAMELGSLKHTEWERHIKKTGKIPDELGGGNVSRKAMVEEFMGCTIPFSDEYQIYLIGKFDLVDMGVITDFKCGVSEPSTHISGYQLGYYQAILKANDIDVKEGRFICFNPYEDKHSIGVRFLNETTLDTTLNHVITHGGEMIQYLQTQKLIKDYDPNWRDKPASQAQIGFMKNLGIDIPDGVTKGQAGDLIDDAKKAGSL